MVSSEGLTFSVSACRCISVSFMVKLIYQRIVNQIYQMSIHHRQKVASVKTGDMLIGALLRAPAQAIHQRIINELNDAGFGGLSVPHMAVLQFPGPDGVRPVTL